jgi:hypothetical protein
MPLDPNTIYLVESDEEPSVLIAIDAKIERRYVGWFDTVRDRLFKVEAVEDEGEIVRVKSPRGTFRFRPLTIELYDEKVRARVTGRPRFGSTAEVQRYYRALPR